MARSNAKLMRAALKEALELFEFEFTYQDGTIPRNGEDPNGGQAWVMQARKALGLDPITGKRRARRVKD